MTKIFTISTEYKDNTLINYLNRVVGSDECELPNGVVVTPLGAVSKYKDDIAIIDYDYSKDLILRAKKYEPLCAVQIDADFESMIVKINTALGYKK